MKRSKPGGTLLEGTAALDAVAALGMLCLMVALGWVFG
jgi:hypothetical protein